MDAADGLNESVNVGGAPLSLKEELDQTKKKMTKYAQLAKQKIKIIEEKDAALAEMTAKLAALEAGGAASSDNNNKADDQHRLVEQLRSELSETKHLLERANDDTETLKSRVEELQWDQGELHERIQALTNDVKSKDSELNGLQLQNNELRNSLRDLQQANAALSSTSRDMADVCKRNAELVVEVDVIKNKLTVTVDDYEKKLMLSATENASVLEAMKHELVVSQQRTDSLLGDAAKNEQLAQASIKEYASQLVASQQEISRLESKLDAMSQEDSNKHDINSKHEESIRDLKRELSELRAEADALKKSFNSKNDSAHSMETEIVDLRRELDSLRAQLGDANAENGDLVCVVSDKDAVIRKQEAELDSLKDELAACKETSKESKDQFNAAVESLRLEITDNAHLLQTSLQSLEELRGSFSHAREELDHARSELQKKELININLNQRVQHLQGEISATASESLSLWEREKDLLVSQVKEKEEIIRQSLVLLEKYRLEQGSQPLGVELDRSSEGSQYFGNDTESARLQLALLDIESSFIAKDSLISRLEQTITHLNDNRDNSVGSDNASPKDLVRQLLKCVEDHQTAMMQVMQQHADQVDELETSKVELSTRNLELETQLQTLDQTNKKLMAKLKLVMKEMSEKNETLSSVQEQVQQLSQENQSVVHKLANAEHQLNVLGAKESASDTERSSRICELETERSSLSEEAAKLRGEVECLVAQLSKQQTEELRLREEYKQQTEDLAASRRYLETSLGAAEAKELEVSAVHHQLADANQRQEAAEASRQQLEKDFADVTSKYQRLVDESNEVAVSSSRREQELSESLLTVQVRYEQLSAELENLRLENEASKQSNKDYSLVMEQWSEKVLASQLRETELKNSEQSLNTELAEVRTQLNVAVHQVQLLETQVQERTIAEVKLKEELTAAEAELRTATDSLHMLQTKLDNALTDADSARVEREYQRRQVLELEQQAEDAELMRQETAAETASTLEAQLQEIRAEREKMAIEISSLQAQVAQLQQQQQHVADTDQVRASPVSADGSGAADKGKLEAAELTNKKLVVKVKQLMKETAELKANNERVSKQCHELQESLEGATCRADQILADKLNVAAQLEGLREEKRQLQDQMQQFQDENRHLSDSVQRMEQQRLQRDATIAESVSALSELSALKDQVDALKVNLDDKSRLLEQAEVRIAGFADNEQLLRQELQTIQRECDEAKANAEMLLIAMEMKTEAAIASANVHNSSEAVEELKATLQTVTSAKDALEIERESLLRDKNDAAAKLEAMTDKVKRLKLLLTKSKEQIDHMKQQQEEREAISNSKARSEDDVVSVPHVFAVIGKVNVHALSRGAVSGLGSDDDTWCCIADCSDAHDGGMGSKQSSKYCWVPEPRLLQLLGNGHGLDTEDVRAYKQVNVHPSLTVHEIFASELQNVHKNYQDRIQAVNAELAEVQQSFKDYKLRAQSALKRIGNDERSHKQQVIASENATIDKLNDTVSALNESLASQEDRIRQLQHEIAVRDASITQLGECIQRLEQSSLDKTEECVQLSNELLECKESLRVLEECYDRRSPPTVGPVSNVVTASSSNIHSDSRNGHEAMSLSIGDDERTSPMVVDPIGKDADSDKKLVEHAHVQHSGDGVQNHYGQMAPSKAILYQQVGRYAGPLFQRKVTCVLQVDDDIRETIVALRNENGRLTVEIMDLKTVLGLNSEQVNALVIFLQDTCRFTLYNLYLSARSQMVALKETIADLSSDLAREKEFNAASHRINQEYLVNVLRQFLLTDSASEKAQLVGPITSLLHLRPEDAKQISEKWALGGQNNKGPGGGGGLLSWVLPRNAGAGSGTGANAGKNKAGGVPFDPYTDGLGGLHGYS
jgi:chromosome segregation ATPase